MTARLLIALVLSVTVVIDCAQVTILGKQNSGGSYQINVDCEDTCAPDVCDYMNSCLAARQKTENIFTKSVKSIEYFMTCDLGESQPLYDSELEWNSESDNVRYEAACENCGSLECEKMLKDLSNRKDECTGDGIKLMAYMINCKEEERSKRQKVASDIFGLKPAARKSYSFSQPVDNLSWKSKKSYRSFDADDNDHDD